VVDVRDNTEISDVFHRAQNYAFIGLVNQQK
jgi:hypothetical protein